MPHRDIADMPATDVAAHGNRAGDSDADATDLDLVQPADSPAPLDSPFGSAVSSLMSIFPETSDDLFSLWATDCTPEGPYNGLEFVFPCPLPDDLALNTPLSHALWALDAEFPSLGQAPVLSQAPDGAPETQLCLPSSVALPFGHTLSSDPVGGQPDVAGSAISASPPTPTATTPSTLDSDDILDGDSPTSLETLRHVLRQHYPDQKPPGPLFKNFISKRSNGHHCTLCPYKIQNREQMNQHIMKKHCDHKPFACPVPGCDHRDARRADSIKHREKHEPPKWGCEHCGKLVQNERNLHRHIRNKHPEIDQPPRSRRKSSRRVTQH